jgi:hypothetical protein
MGVANVAEAVAAVEAFNYLPTKLNVAKGSPAADRGTHSRLILN